LNAKRTQRVIKPSVRSPDVRGVKLSCAGASDVGRTRAANEDFLATDPGRGLFVVADGLGGHAAGRMASETAVNCFMEIVPSGGCTDPLAALRSATRAANEAILDRAKAPQLRGMATTLAALWMHEGSAVLAHVGDSRIYMLRQEELHPLTIDHSYVCELMFRRRLDAESARHHPNRHVIMRALGVAPAPEPDVSSLAAKRGDVFLLCTDGVHGQLNDEEIREVVLAAGDDVDAAARALVDFANLRGGQDNATVVLVRVC
jgi:PPM family protein phosphatase